MRGDRLVLAIIALALALRASSGVSQQRFSSRAEGVRVDVLVTDGSRRVKGLSADDFEVSDKGVVQRITAIDVERVPLNVILVFDVSDSVAGARLHNLIAAGGSVIDQLRDSDRVALITFATHLSLPQPLTSDRERARRALSTLRGAATTALRDATFAALTLRDADPARTLVLVFSDGFDTASWLGADAVLEASKRSDAVVYAVEAPLLPIYEMTSVRDRRSGLVAQRPLPPSFPHSTAPKAVALPVRFLQDIAALTGGAVTTVETDKDLASTFTSILGEFRDRYVLSYIPSGVDAPGWHELSVKAKGKSVKVTARRGYFAQ